jgi:exosome complex component CSL4
MVLPGETVTVAKEVLLGRGLYRSPEDGLVRASLRGELVCEKDDAAALVARIKTSGRAAVVPEVGQTVVGRVVRLCTRFAALDILYIDADAGGSAPQWLGEPFRGTLRAGDIWPAGTRDPPALIAHAVRPGDLVRARVVGMGEASAGFLVACGGPLVLPPAEYAAATRANTAVGAAAQVADPGLQVQCADVDALGVVVAVSQTSGLPMVPVAWNEMMCPRTGARESRRPAKPVC